MNFWLMKSEPDVYSLADLKRDRTTLWEGVRNYQARNFMMKEMKPSDPFLFYHSNAEPPGVAGLGQIRRAAVPDPSAQNKKSEYFDPNASPEKPIWYCVEVQFHKIFPNFVSLPEIKARRELQQMLLVKPGTRLSIQPVGPDEFELICKMGGL